MSIEASSVNPLDTKIAVGKVDHTGVLAGSVLGINMAGLAEAVGAGVTGFQPRDEVYGMIGGVGGAQGLLAEFAAVEAAPLARKPANI